MTEFLPRSAWADSDWSRGGARLTGTQLVGCANHWPGTATSAYGVESRAKVRARIRGWWNYHVNGRGWSDIGYGVAFDQAGRVWDLRGIGRVGAHSASASNPDANHEWVGCLFILGANEQPTLAMIAAYQQWRHDVFLRRWPGRTDMTGHGRAPGVPGAQTSCPGPRVAALITDGTLKQPPEDDMPSPKDWTDADWAAFDAHMWRRANTVNDLLPGHMIRKTYEAVAGHDAVPRPDQTKEDTETSLPYALGRIWVHVYRTIPGILEAQRPLLEAAAKGEALTSEQVQEIAQQISDALPLAEDVAEEIGERLTGEEA